MAKGNIAKCFSSLIRQTYCNTTAGCICASFKVGKPTLVFPCSKFPKQKDLRVSGEAGLWFRARSAYMVPLAIPAHSLLSTLGEDPPPPLPRGSFPLPAMVTQLLRGQLPSFEEKTLKLQMFTVVPFECPINLFLLANLPIFTLDWINTKL